MIYRNPIATSTDYDFSTLIHLPYMTELWIKYFLSDAQILANTMNMISISWRLNHFQKFVKLTATQNWIQNTCRQSIWMTAFSEKIQTNKTQRTHPLASRGSVYCSRHLLSCNQERYRICDNGSSTCRLLFSSRSMKASESWSWPNLLDSFV